MQGTKNKVILAGLIFCLLSLQGGQPKNHPSSLLRFHVRANSDSPLDQAIKYEVRDAVLQALDARLREAADPLEAEVLVAAALPEIEAVALAAIQLAGLDYSVTATLEDADFPTRLYGDSVYRAGRYRALQVYLGEGHGRNWWCVLFPPLCFVEVPNDASIVAVSHHDPPRIKSRLLEWWEKIFARQA